MFDLLAEFGHLVQGVRRAVHLDPGEALCLQRAEQVDELPLALPDHRRQHLEAGALGHLQDLVHYLLRGLA